MTIDALQEILAGVEQPSRYLGGEVNAVRKDAADVALRVALAFPDLYEIGTSHFGVQILYHLLNQDPRIAAERVFAPAPDLDRALAAQGLPLFSLESRTPLAEFDLIGFSLLYELNYTNILAMLDRAGIPFYAGERDERHPLIIAGGPCTCNPEPLAPFFDAMVIGDGEATMMPMAEAWLAWDRRDRGALFDEWAKIKGVYIPSRYRAHYDTDGFAHIVAEEGVPMPVQRAVVADLDQAAFPARPVVAFGRPVHDRLRLEIARGCTRGCRFCQAGMIYRPVRERSPGKLMELVRSGLENTGYEDVSLLSLSTGDYSCINGLTETLMAELAPRHIALSLPSLRAGTLSPELMERIRQVRKTGFTFAVEAGSQRLRDVINKNISEQDVFDTLRDAFDLGWQTIKLYFMIGLPTETDVDLGAVVTLVEKLRRLRPAGGRRGQLNVSVATFIPKPHTPFQWAAQDSLEEAQAKIDRLKRALTRPGVEVKWQNPRVSLLEGLWARGDRRLAPLLVEAYRRGCRLDGWSDQFRFDAWTEAIGECGIDVAFFTTRERRLQEALPWDHVDVGVRKAFLQSEWQRALAETPTADCRVEECQGCGVCDFVHLAPLTHAGQTAPAPLLEMPPADETAEVVLRLRFCKTGPARLFGHLETASIFQRAFRRARLACAFSGGFHPKPKMAFDDALPLGLESRNEYLTVSLNGPVEAAAVMDRLNRQLPEGFAIQEVFVGEKDAQKPDETYCYRVRCPQAVLLEPQLAAFRQAEQWVLERVSNKGRKQRIDLKQAVAGMDIDGDDGLWMRIRNQEGPRVRPADVLKAVFGLDDGKLARVRVVKQKDGSAPWSEEVACSAS